MNTALYCRWHLLERVVCVCVAEKLIIHYLQSETVCASGDKSRRADFVMDPARADKCYPLASGRELVCPYTVAKLPVIYIVDINDKWTQRRRRRRRICSFLVWTKGRSWAEQRRSRHSFIYRNDKWTKRVKRVSPPVFLFLFSTKN